MTYSSNSAQHPRISVVLPTYNRAYLLEKTLSALQNQDCDPTIFEIIVVDDGSTDETQERVKQFRQGFGPQLRYLRQRNRGPAVARNAGVRSALGELIAFIDDDCIPAPDWVRQITSIQDCSDVLGVAGLTRGVVHENFYLQYLSDRGSHDCAPRDQFDTISYPITLNAAFKGEAFLLAGGFDERFPLAAGEDVDFGLRLREAGFGFNENLKAVIEHHHRSSMGSILKTWFNYGKGRSMWMRKRRRTHSIAWDLVLELKYLLTRNMIPLFQADLRITKRLSISLKRYFVDMMRDISAFLGGVVGLVLYTHVKRQD